MDTLQRLTEGIGIAHVALDDLGFRSHFGTEEGGVSRETADTLPALFERSEQTATDVTGGAGKEDKLAFDRHTV
jgi:hypothetical protein